MSATQSRPTLESKLKTLQCHFTWDLEYSSSKLLCLRDHLEDIRTEEGYSWLGHIYNLQGFIHHKLDFTNSARCFFSRAAEAFRQIRNTVSEEGPWLVVNYGNLAWLHHLLGERSQSQEYVSKVDALMENYPSPSQEKLHPEIYAEKGWTLMKFSREQRVLAADLLKRAITMQPEKVEWNTSHVLALFNTAQHHNKALEPDLLEKMKIAMVHDPENLYLAVLQLEGCAQKGKNILQEARQLARRVLMKPQGCYSGIKPLLRVYRVYISMDEAIDLAEEFLERDPEDRYLKVCAAICYKMKILLDKDDPLEHGLVQRAVSLHRDAVSLYPQSNLKIQIDLANIHGESKHQAEADQIYQDLLKIKLDPEETQMLYNSYAKYVHFIMKDSSLSIRYHMMAAEVPFSSMYRDNSIRTLERIRDRNRNHMCPEIEGFLEYLKD